MKLKISLVLLVAFVSTSLGWQRIGGKEYVINRNWKFTYFEAHQQCYDMGGRLADIDSNFEMDTLNEGLIHDNDGPMQRLWTAGNDLGSGMKDWRSINTEKRLTYIRWRAGEPSNYYNEHCLELTNESTGKFGMNDENCRTKVGYICERTIEH